MKKNTPLCFACGWFCLTGYGAIHYADCTRPDDSGAGMTWSTAKQSLQAAVDISAKGDTVLVAPGIYDAGQRITPGGWLSNRVVVTKDITLVSRDGADTTIIMGARDSADATYQGCGSNAVRCVYMAVGKLKGFTLTGGAAGSENKENLNNRGGGFYAPTNKDLPEIYDCIISNNAAIRGGGAYAGTFHRCRIIGNYAQKNGAGVRDSELHNCLVVYNYGSGAAFCYAKSYWPDNGIFNCTIAYNTGPGMECSSAHNTISTGNSSAFSGGALPKITFVNCCLSSATAMGSNNIEAAYARFVDAAGGDFRLLENSPCLDTGNSAFLSSASGAAGHTDFLGAPRVQGKGVDIGAIEGVVAGIAAVAIDPPQGKGKLSPSKTLILKNLPTQVVFTATANEGASLRHFTLDGEAFKKHGNTFTLEVVRPGGYSVSAIFQKAFPWNPHLTEAEVIAEPSFADPTEGRLEEQPALYIEEGALAWKCRDLGSSCFIEFWFQPLAWDATGNDAVELCRLTVGAQTYVLSKVAGKSNLSFGADGETSAIYPVYAWDDAQWAKNMPRKKILHRSVGWHHVSMTVLEKQLRLTVDGFPAREIKTIKVNGTLEQLALSGNPGTAFTLPLLGRGGSFDPPALRKRFLALFLNETQMRPRLLTAPLLKTPPKVDGHLAANEWDDATQFTGWAAIRDGQLAAEDLTGYIGYKDDWLYIAMTAPNKTCTTPSREPERENTGEQSEGLNLFIGPPFVSGENPRRLLQFTGTLSGTQTQRQVLPVRDNQWRGKWQWATSITNGQRIAEFVARFDDIDLPRPAPGEIWTIKLLDKHSGLTWSYPDGGETNVASMGELQFDPKVPALRLGDWTVKDNLASVSLGINGLRKSHRLTAGIQLYGGNDLLPTTTIEKSVVWKGKETVTLDLESSTGVHSYGRIAVYVKDGTKYIYYHIVGFPRIEGGAAQ